MKKKFAVAIPGVGNARLVRQMHAVLCGECENRTSLRESVECHLMGISAEESRLDGGRLVRVHGE